MALNLLDCAISTCNKGMERVMGEIFLKVHYVKKKDPVLECQ